MKIKGIALAAGYGTRLRPLTDIMPKPLLPLCGKPMIDIVLDRLFDAGAGQVCVNTHHLGAMMSSHLAPLAEAGKVKLFNEESILGTGGPLVNAKETLSDCDAFILHNGDIVADFDLKAMLVKHIESKSVATMALIDGPENRVLSDRGSVLDILGKLKVESDSAKMLTYAGIAVFSPEIFKFLPAEPCCCSIIDAILGAMAERPGSVGAFYPSVPYFWSDIGSFEQYLQAHSEILLRGAMPSLSVKGFIHADKSSLVSKGARLSGFVSIGRNCRINPEVRMSNCVVLDGVEVSGSENRAWEVITPSFSCCRDSALIRKLKFFEGADFDSMKVQPLVEHGSDRRFYRISQDGGRTNSVLMLSSASDQDFGRFLELGTFFRAGGLPTPEIKAHEHDKFAVLMEDLGDSTVYNIMTGTGYDASETEPLYMKVIDSLALFQRDGTRAVRGAPDIPLRIFDYAYLRWESNYFKENFLERLCGIKMDYAKNLLIASEFHLLAAAVNSMDYTLMHRDFQSQNILLSDGTVRYVDFQGARLGPYTYDIASLVKDPYIMLSKPLRTKLYEYYYHALKKCGFDIPYERYRVDSVLSSLQRNMQALGAYGFLSLAKKKVKYLDYAEPCLELLSDGLDEFETLRGLTDVRLDFLTDCVRSARDSVRESVASARRGMS